MKSRKGNARYLALHQAWRDASEQLAHHLAEQIGDVESSMYLYGFIDGFGGMQPDLSHSNEDDYRRGYKRGKEQS